MGAAGAVAAAAASAAGVAGAVLAVVSATSMSLCAPSSTSSVLHEREGGGFSFTTHQHAKGHTKHKTFTPRTHHTRFIQMLADVRIFTGITFSTVSLCLSPRRHRRPTARARSGSQSFHTELGGPPARRPAFKFSKEETRSRGESQRHPLRGHASVHVPLGAPVLVSVENIQSRGNRVGRKRTGGTDCVARRRDNCERTVSRSRLHEALRRRPMLCSGGHAQQVSYTYGVHGAW